MNDLNAWRAKEMASLQTMRNAVVGLLFSPDAKVRRAAAPRLRAIDTHIRQLGGKPDEPAELETVYEERTAKQNAEKMRYE